MRPNQALFESLGPETFSEGVGEFAPYFSTIDPNVVALRPGYCEVHLKNQSKVHNHFGTVHAIAMCNAAELAGGMATDVSVADDARWIPKGMTVAYLKKAKTDLRVVCDASGVSFDAEGDVVVHVVALDESENVCFTADITMNIKL